MPDTANAVRRRHTTARPTAHETLSRRGLRKPGAHPPPRPTAVAGRRTTKSRSAPSTAEVPRVPVAPDPPLVAPEPLPPARPVTRRRRATGTRPVGVAAEDDLFVTLLAKRQVVAPPEPPADTAAPPHTHPAHAAHSAHHAVHPAAPADAAATEIGAGTAPGGLTSRRRIILTAAGLTVLAGAVTFQLWSVGHSSDHAVPPATAGVSTDEDLHTAETWMVGNVGRSTPVATDARVAKQLAAQGLSTTVARAAGSEPFLLSTPDLRIEAIADRALSRRIDATVLVAGFGSGTRRVELRQSAPEGIAALAHDWSAERATRTDAGRQLLGNGRITVTGPPRQLLADGRLDLRAETLLGRLATRGAVDITGLDLDPQIVPSDEPARAVVLAMPRSRITAVVSTLPPAYRPTSIVTIGTDHVRVTWPLTPQAVRPIG